MLLAGVLLKVGTYGLIRFNLALFPEASRYFAHVRVDPGGDRHRYGAVVALIQTDIKRLVAYSSVSHLGFVVLGIFAFTEQAVTGGVLQMVNHGLATGRPVPAGGHGLRTNAHPRTSRRWAGWRA